LCVHRSGLCGPLDCSRLRLGVITVPMERLPDASKMSDWKDELLAALDAAPFRAAWWLPGGHLQTVWAPLFRRAPRPAFQSAEWHTPDDDFLSVHRLDGQPEHPTVLLLHGLESGSNAAYVRGMAALLAASGWSCVALEFRGCSARMNRTARM